jgi:hypothetical protein
MRLRSSQSQTLRNHLAHMAYRTPSVLNADSVSSDVDVLLVDSEVRGA